MNEKLLKLKHLKIIIYIYVTTHTTYFCVLLDFLV